MDTDRRKAVGFGLANVLTGALAAYGVFAGLPIRWWVVDVPSVVVSAALTIAGVALLARASWARGVARVAAMLSLAVGLALVALLMLSASFLAGVYGPVGRGGVTIMVLVSALALPYLVVLPAVELLWLGPRAK
jgi:hypothetical protein